MNVRVKGMGRAAAVTVFTVFLSGCALPLPVQIASWALDGISFLATKKSLSDHGLSMVAQKDCALWRGLKGEEVCSDFDDGGTFAVAAAQADVAADEEIATTPPPAVVDEDVASLANFETAAGSANSTTTASTSSNDGERLMISGKRVWTEQLNADLYFIIGSYSNRDNARAMVADYKDLGPAVMASRLDGVEVYRVAVGPFTGDQKRDMQLKVKRAGIGNAWAMRIDHRDWKLASPSELSAPIQAVAEIPAAAEPVTNISPPAKKANSEELAETPAQPGPAPGQSSELIMPGKRLLVIASFSNADNARNFAKSKADLGPQILSAELAQGWRHRVVVGPYDKAESLAVRKRLAITGIENIWALNMQPEVITGDTLLAEDQAQPVPGVAPESEEIAETPIETDPEGLTNTPAPATPSGDEMGWGVNLVEYIFDMFRSSDSTDVVGIISSLEG